MVLTLHDKPPKKGMFQAIRDNEAERWREKLTVAYLEPLVAKAKQAYIDAVLNDNYRGYEEHFIAEYLVKALQKNDK